MRLKLALVTGSETDDISVTVDSTATVGQLAERLLVSHPSGRMSVTSGPSLCIRVNPGRHGERTVAPAMPMGEAGIRSGDAISLTMATPGQDASSGVAATIRVVAGPDAGKSFSIGAGTSLVGRDRDCDVLLSDQLVSKRHAKINVSDMVEIIDDNSANGVQIAGDIVQRCSIRADDVVRLGDTELAVTLHSTAGGISVGGGSSIEFNRSPRLDPKYPGLELKAPEPPERPKPPRFHVATLVAPLFMGLILYAVTRNVFSVMFIAMSPFMMLGMYFENRRQTKKSLEQMCIDYRAALRDLAVQLQYAAEAERTRRRLEHPSIDEIASAVHSLAPLMWTRRPEHDSFAQVRFGLGTQASRTTVEMPTKNTTLPELWKELHDVVGRYTTIERVPVVADLRQCGSVGIAGPVIESHPLAAATVAQFVGLHSPAELILGAITTPQSTERWEWLKWLPHAGSEHSPLAAEHLASNPRHVSALVADLEELVENRAAIDRDDDNPIPLVLIVVEDDAAADRARLVQLAERGPAQGIHLIWVSPSLERVPAACRSFIDVDPATPSGLAGFVRTGEGVDDLEVEPLGDSSARELASALSPVADAGALLEDQSDLPRSVSFLALSGSEFADSPTEIVEQWRGHNSVPEPEAPKLKRDNTLRALVGQSVADRFYLDLRTQGPHALVGGTTGAGKSEFLQSWILGMAAAHSSARVNFLFVDYKGGAAFADCIDLPHCVGLVTDLSPHLVRRALRSLNAELRRREHILNRKKAKDLLELERRRDPETPPSLVIIVDEFAALVSEVPEFVDGVVNVAQRGRSLGLHLILATQRPAGVIKDNLRANTNLRVALRMADEDDSTDVVGSTIAGTFDPSIPGRGVAKTGPGRLASFQAAYVGGHTSNEPPIPVIDVHELPFGLGQSWDVPSSAADDAPVEVGASDIRRMVDNIVSADRSIGLAEPQKPWLPELSNTYQLQELPSPRTDEHLIFGVIDHPDEQQQPVVGFQPDRDGHMAIYGTGGAGKSGFLRSIAIAAGFSAARGGPCHVYGLDFGARGLAMLEALPHVGAIINAEDQERTIRLLKMLRQTIDERSARYSDVNAASIVEYRAASGKKDEPRLLLLLDNFPAFRSAYEIGRPGNPYELLESIVAEGRSVGVHLLATSDQANAFTASFRSVIQSELVLRLASENDLLMLGVKPDVFGDDTPAGRGFIGDSEVQVAILRGDPNAANQAAEVAKLAEVMHRQGVSVAPEIERLSEDIPFASVSQHADHDPILGVWDETLEPISFEPSGLFLISGPPRSGKTSTVVSMLRSLDETGATGPRVLFSSARSELIGARQWSTQLSDQQDIAGYAESLTGQIKALDVSLDGLVVVIEGISEFVNGLADDHLSQLLRAMRSHQHLVLVEGEPVDFNGNYGLMGTVKLDRTGIVLQPDQANGDGILGTDFPRVSRIEFPPGRGLYARAGHVNRVQVLNTTG